MLKIIDPGRMRWGEEYFIDESCDDDAYEWMNSENARRNDI